MKKIKLKELWHRKDCYGWAFPCTDKNGKYKKGRYLWHNDNDLGLFSEDLDFYVWITKKIEIVKGKYLYLVSQRVSTPTDDTDSTIPTIKAYLKYQHNDNLTQREQTLVNKENKRW